MRPHLIAAVVSLIATLPNAAAGQCVVETIAGGGTELPGENGPALQTALNAPGDLARGPDGSVYIADTGHHRIRRLTPGGRLETIAGAGLDVPSGDGGEATRAGLRSPISLAFGPDGSLYILESGPAVRRIDPRGVISTFAGGHNQTGPAEDVPAAEANLDGTTSLAAGPDGSLFLVNRGDRVVRRIGPDGIVRRFAGGGFQFDPPVPALEGAFREPADAVVDAEGTVYVADRGRILRIGADGAMTLFVDEARNSHGIRVRPQGVVLDEAGRPHWYDFSAIRRFSDGGGAETAWADGERFGPLAAVIHTRDGWVALERHQAVLLDPRNQRRVIAGTPPDRTLRGDGGPALAARLEYPSELAVGPDGAVYVVDYSNKVRRIKDGVISTVAGDGRDDRAGDGGPATQASFDSVRAVALGTDNTLYAGDSNSVRRIASDGTIHAFAGTGEPCRTSALNRCGDGGPALNAQVSAPGAIVSDPAGNVYLLTQSSKTLGRWVRRIDPQGRIETLSPELPDGSYPEQASGIALTPENHLIVVAPGREGPKFWRYSPEGAVARYPVPEGYLASQNAWFGADAAGNLLYGLRDGRLSRVTPDGVVEVLLRPDAPWSPGQGDGGPPQGAHLDLITGMAVARDGRVYLSDGPARRVRSFSLAECEPVDAPRIARNGVVNAASLARTIAPGALFTIFGDALGPRIGVVASVFDGRYPADLAGVRVWVDGRPAPLLFVSRGQINAVTPFATPNGIVQVEVEREGLRSEASLHQGTLRSAPFAPGIFALDEDQAAVLNQDGSLNSPENPAPRGSIVALFGSGGGLTDPSFEDGVIASQAAPLVRPLTVLTGGGTTRAEVLYAGQAPGLVAGVIQLNVRLPTDLSWGRWQVVIRAEDFLDERPLFLYTSR